MREESAEFLTNATKDIITTALKEIDTGDISEDDLEDSQAYVIIHRDNPNTKEILGSVNIRLPFLINDESRAVLQKMNVPTNKAFLTCFGVFDASVPDLKDISISCSIRNEHGFPISYATTSLYSKMEEASKKLTDTIRREVREDVEKFLKI